jgi:hypothetical protein
MAARSGHTKPSTIGTHSSPFISISTIRAALSRLQKLGVVLMKKLAKWKSNRTNYYTIDYQQLEAIAQVTNHNGALVPIKLAHASAKNPQTHVPTPDPSICQDLAHGDTEILQRAPQRKKQRASEFSTQPEPIVIISPKPLSTQPIAPTPIAIVGTTHPSTPTAPPEQLEAMPVNQRELWKQLRLAKLDIAYDDPLIADWIRNNLVKHIIQHLLDAKSAQPQPSRWHTPAQMGLYPSSRTQRRVAA